MTAQDFWDDKDRAQAKMEEVSRLKNRIQPFHALTQRVEDLGVLYDMAREENNN